MLKHFQMQNASNTKRNFTILFYQVKKNHNVTSRSPSDNCDGNMSIRILNNRNKFPITFRLYPGYLNFHINLGVYLNKKNYLGIVLCCMVLFLN